jgi:hypothetical protein
MTNRKNAKFGFFFVFVVKLSHRKDYNIGQFQVNEWTYDSEKKKMKKKQQKFEG